MEAIAQPEIGVHVAPGVWMRRPQRTYLFAGCWLVLGLCMAAMPIVPSLSSAQSLSGVLLEILFIALFSAPLLVLAWRYYRSGLLISGEGVVVRGVIRSHRLGLREVQHFDMGIVERPGALEAAYGIVVVREGGKAPIPVTALGKSGWNTAEGQEEADARWRPTVDAMNALLGGLKGEEAPVAPEKMPPTAKEIRRYNILYPLFHGATLIILLVYALVSPHPVVPLVIGTIYVPISIYVFVKDRRHWRDAGAG